MALRGTAILGVALLAASCGLSKTPSPLPTATVVDTNLIANNGFEAGVAPWVAATLPNQPGKTPSISDGVAHAGTHSVELRLTSSGEGSGVNAASQSVATKDFPEFFAGFYRIDDWQPHALFQYVYFSVNVHGGEFSDPGQPHEVRFLTGARIEPSLEPGVVYVFLSRDAPVVGKWTYFSYPVKTAFEHFGALPAKWDSVDVSVGVRYDGQQPQDASSSADVFYDDLYLGPQASNPDRLPDGQ